MKKILKVFFSIVLILTASSCTKMKDVDEVNEILKSNNYQVTFGKDDSGYTINLKIDKSGWCYFLSDDILTYYNNSVVEINDKSWIINAKTKNSFDLSTHKKESNQNNDHVNLLISDQDEKLEQLSLTIDEIYNLITTNLKDDLDSYLKTEKGQLTMKFRLNEDDIENLTNEQISSFLKYANENDSLSYDEIVEKYYLNDFGFDSTLLETLTRIKKGMNVLGYSLNNFNVETGSDSTSYIYDVYKSGSDTNFNLWLVDLDKKDLQYKKNIMFTLDNGTKTPLESDEIIAVCSGIILSATNDTNSSSKNILSLALKSYEEYITHKDWVFKMNLDNGITFYALHK